MNMDNILTGEYFIRNAEYYTHMEGNQSSLNVVLGTFVGGGNQEWKIIYLHNGYFKIITLDENYAISVASNGDIVLEPHGYYDNQMWSISQDSEGLYRISPKSNSSLYLSATNLITTETRNIQLTNSQSGYSHKWEIRDYVDYVLMCLGNSPSDFSMNDIYYNITGALSTNNMFGYGGTTMEKDNLISYLKKTAMFSCITHGHTDSIELYGDEFLTVSDINAIESSDLQNLKFVYLGACDTGAIVFSGYNLVDTIFNKGVDAVLGFNDKVDIAETNYWSERFMVYLSTGMTIADAINYADEDTKTHFNYENINDATTSQKNRYFKGNAQLSPCANS